MSKRMRMSCVVCNISYVTNHTCKGGKCHKCDRVLVNLKLHICPMDKIENFNLPKMLKESTGDGQVCSRCGDHHLCTKNANGFRKFLTESGGIALFCSDCFHSDVKIENHIRRMRSELMDRDVSSGQTHCAMCYRQLIQTHGDENSMVRRYERDHIDVSSKVESVSVLLQQGYISS